MLLSILINVDIVLPRYPINLDFATQEMMTAAGAHPASWIDITGDVCPMTFVRVKLALERLPAGEILGVRLNAGEPLRNVPRSARAEGHEILEVRAEPESPAIFRMIIRRG